MNVYISSALDPKSSIVSGVTNPTPSALQSLVLDDTVAIVAYIVDGAGAYDAASGAVGYSATMLLGAAYEDPVVSVDMTRGTSCFTGDLTCNTQELQDLFATGENPITLVWTLKVTDTASRVRTYAAVPVKMYATSASSTDAASRQEVFYYDGTNPNTSVMATGPAICHGSDGSLWRKTTAGTSANEWTAIIGGVS